MISAMMTIETMISSARNRPSTADMRLRRPSSISARSSSLV
jgi:hypothetical protein